MTARAQRAYGFETMRGIGGVYLHLVGEAWAAICGYTPALGWAQPERRDWPREICQKCVRFAALEPLQDGRSGPSGALEGQT